MRSVSRFHEIGNQTETAIRVLMLSTRIMPDVVHYPDSGKFGGRDANGERVLMTRAGSILDYWDGEE
jgi:uncharacterized cupin superfamily protein